VSLGAWWSQSVLPWGLEATAVGGLLLLVLRMGRRWPPSVRAALATLGLAKMTVPPILLPAGLLTIRVTEADGRLSALGTRLAEDLLAPAWLDALALLHGAGVLVAMALLVRQVAQIRDLRRTSVEAPPRILAAARRVAGRFDGRAPSVRTSPRVPVPVVVGLVRPLILIPDRLAARLSERQLEALVAHELAHVRAGDLWVAWLRALVSCLWWFHPLAQRLGKWQVEASEERCDDRVLASRCSSAEAYARALVAAAESSLDQRLPALAATGGATGIESRVRRLAGPPVRSRPLVWLVVALLAAVLLPASFLGRSGGGGWSRQYLVCYPDPFHGALGSLPPSDPTP